MAYVGRGIDNISNASILDVISFTNSAGPYNLEKGSAAFTPISVQALVISVDGVIQAPDSYTISAATITFGVSMASSLTNDFIVHNGVGLITEPSDGSVTAAKLATDAVTNIKVADDAIGVDELSATGTASSSTYLRGDNAWSSIAADTNDKVSVSADDTTPGYLNGKLVAGTNISLTEGSGGGDETLTAAFTGNLAASVINSGTIATARLGTGTASSSTVLYGDQTYKAEPGGGKINQVLQSSRIAVSQAITSTSYIDVTNITIDITPSAASSKIWIVTNIGLQTPSTSYYGNLTILRDSTNLGDATEGFGRFYTQASGYAGVASLNYLDSPSSTSALTYKLQASVQSASYSMTLNNFGASYITVMEVLA